MYPKCTRKVWVASQWDFRLHPEGSELVSDLLIEGFPIVWKVMGVSSWGLDFKPHPISICMPFRHDAVPHHRIADQATLA